METVHDSDSRLLNTLLVSRYNVSMPPAPLINALIKWEQQIMLDNLHFTTQSQCPRSSLGLGLILDHVAACFYNCKHEWCLAGLVVVRFEVDLRRSHAWSSEIQPENTGANLMFSTNPFILSKQTMSPWLGRLIYLVKCMHFYGPWLSLIQIKWRRKKRNCFENISFPLKVHCNRHNEQIQYWHSKLIPITTCIK